MMRAEVKDMRDANSDYLYADIKTAEIVSDPVLHLVEGSLLHHYACKPRPRV